MWWPPSRAPAASCHQLHKINCHTLGLWARDLDFRGPPSRARAVSPARRTDTINGHGVHRKRYYVPFLERSGANCKQFAGFQKSGGECQAQSATYRDLRLCLCTVSHECNLCTVCACLRAACATRLLAGIVHACVLLVCIGRVCVHMCTDFM